MKTKRLIGLRGLTRGQGHWGNFPRILNSLDASIDFELLEIPGNGTRFSESPPTQAEEALAMIRKKSRFVKDQKSFSILGISLGGMLALKWAELFPQEILTLFIVNSSLSQLSPFYRRLQLRQVPHILKTLRESDFIEREKMILSMTSNEPQKIQDQLLPMAAFSQQYQVSRMSFIRQLRLASQVQIQNQICAKVKIICSQEDRLVHSSCSTKLAQYFDGKSLIHPTAGHDLPLDDPQWLAKIVIDNF